MALPPFVQINNSILEKKNPTPESVIKVADLEVRSKPLQNGGGIYSRYFAVNLTSNKVDEISLLNYRKILPNSTSPEYRAYSFHEITWYSSRPRQDYLEGPYLRHGSNIKNVAATQHIPELFDYLANTGQLLVENLEALPNQFKTRDGRIYTGYYHIHREAGPLTGKRHTADTHRRLYTLDHVFLPYSPDIFKSKAKLYRNQPAGEAPLQPNTPTAQNAPYTISTSIPTVNNSTGIVSNEEGVG